MSALSKLTLRTFWPRIASFRSCNLTRPAESAWDLSPPQEGRHPPSPTERFVSKSLLANLRLEALDLSDESLPLALSDDLVQALASSLGVLKVLELTRCVQCLALWPDFRNRRITAPTECEHQIIRLSEMLEAESIRRLSMSALKDDVDLYLWTIEDRIDLATAWSLTQKCSASQSSYIHSFVDKSGTSESRVNSFLKRASPRQMVELMRLVLTLPGLPTNFHNYYVILKFVDMFSAFSSDDILVYVQAMAKFDIVVSANHPVAEELVLILLDRCTQDAATLKEGPLLAITNFLARYCLGVGYHQESMNNLLAAFEPRAKTLQLPALIQLVYLSTALPTSNEVIIQEIIGQVRQCTDSSVLKLQDFCNLTQIMLRHGQYFSESQLTVVADFVASGIAQPPLEGQRHAKQLVECTFNLLCDGRFYPDLIHRIFSDDMLVKKSECGRTKLRGRYLFSTQPRIMNTTRHLVTLAAIVHIDYGDLYCGPIIDHATSIMLPNCPSELLVSWLGTNWLASAHRLKETLEQTLGGEEFVAENYVLPYSELPTLVFIIDPATHEPVRIPESYRTLERNSLKYTIPLAGVDGPCWWFAIHLMSNKRGNFIFQHQKKLRSLLDQHFRALGYRERLEFDAPPFGDKEIGSEGVQEAVDVFMDTKMIPKIKKQLV